MTITILYSLFRLFLQFKLILSRGEDSNLRSPKTTDLQSVAIDHSATSGIYSSILYDNNKDIYRSNYLLVSNLYLQIV